MAKIMNAEARQITEEKLVELADDMAAAAVSFSSHGYDQFIQAREAFKEASRQIFNSD